MIDKVTSKQCMLTALYAPVRSRDKDIFCNNLKQLNMLITLPWCLIGDFNELLQPSDKVGGAPPTLVRTRRLNDFLAHTNSFYAHVQGREYTWKKFLLGQLAHEKLDRVIFREDWAQLCPNYLVSNGPFTCSDHAFVLLTTDPVHPPRRGTLFKYQHS